MQIEISEQDLTCLIFWHSMYKSIVTEGKEDRDLFDRLASIWFSLNPSGFCYWTGVPKYQPGEEEDVEIRIRSKDEGGTP